MLFIWGNVFKHLIISRHVLGQATIGRNWQSELAFSVPGMYPIYLEYEPNFLMYKDSALDI